MENGLSSATYPISTGSFVGRCTNQGVLQNEQCIVDCVVTDNERPDLQPEGGVYISLPLLDPLTPPPLPKRPCSLIAYIALREERECSDRLLLLLSLLSQGQESD